MDGLDGGVEGGDHVCVEFGDWYFGGGGVEDVVCTDPEGGEGGLWSGDVVESWLGVGEELLGLVYKRYRIGLVSRGAGDDVLAECIR